MDRKTKRTELNAALFPLSIRILVQGFMFENKLKENLSFRIYDTTSPSF